MAESAKVVRLEPESQRLVRARLARLPAAMHALLACGKKSLLALLEVYFDSADDALFDLADKANNNQDQNLFFDSMREVRVQRKGIERRFAEAMEQACAALVSDGGRQEQHSDGELSAEALALVQNDDLEQMVALESTVGRAVREHQYWLEGLTGGIATLVAEEVTGSNNPFGPQVICSTMMAQIKRLDIDIKAKLVLFKLFDRVVVGGFPQLYKQLAKILTDHGVALGGVRQRAQAPSTGAPVQEPPPTTAGGAAASGPSPSTPQTASNEGSRQDLLELLSFVQKLPTSNARTSGMDLEQILASVQRHRGQQVAIGRVEQETMRLVQMLFNFILQEHSLPEPMRDLLARMQVPVLKVALTDESFLSDNKHAARRLINEMASVAVGLQASDPARAADDPLFQFMHGTIDRLLKRSDKNTNVFQDALADFTSYVEKERRRAAVLERRTVDAEDGKARAEQARKTVQTEIELRTMAHNLPEVVRALVFGPWSNVLFVTGLKFGFNSTEWSEQLKVLNELIWSVQPCTAKSDRQRLIRLIPDLMQRLRKGLDSVSYNPFEVSELFTGLEEVHLARIRGEALPGEEAPLAEAPAKASPTPIKPAAGTKPPETSVREAKEETLPADDPHMITVAAFAQGSWFDLVTLPAEGEELTLRCRLAAYIKPTAKYIFVNRSGMKVAEKSQQDLAWALKRGQLRALDNSMLFDRALESIVSGMRKPKSGMTLDSSEHKPS